MDINNHIKGLNEARIRAWEAQKAELDATAGRERSAEEQARIERMDADIDRLDAEIRTFVQREQRERLVGELAQLPGAHVFPSQANMVLVRVPDSQRAFDGLKRHGVLVKHIAGLHPLLARCLPLTVGTPEENDAMIKALESSL